MRSPQNLGGASTYIHLCFVQYLIQLHLEKIKSGIAFVTRPQKTDHLQSVCTCLTFLTSGGETAEEGEEEEEVEEKTEEAEKEEAAEPAKGKGHASLGGSHSVTVLFL